MDYSKLEASCTEIWPAAADGSARDNIYEFRIKRHLDDGWSVCLEGLTILRQEDGTTLLVGTVVDQAALHGVIARIRDLGLPLPSVRRTLEPQGSTH